MMAALASGVLLSCSAEDGVEQQINSLNSVGATTNQQVAEITESDLLGRWELVSMTSVGVPVNFNGDQVETTDILSETACFSSMYFTFKSNGALETEQARLYFDDTGNFTCSAKVYEAEYEVSVDTLSITFMVKGTSYTEHRKVIIEKDDEKEYLNMSLTGVETDAAVYVEDGRENTVAKNIVQINFKYVKK